MLKEILVMTWRWLGFSDFLLLLLTQSVWHLVLVLLGTTQLTRREEVCSLCPENKKVKIVETAGVVSEEPRL